MAGVGASIEARGELAGEGKEGEGDEGEGGIARGRSMGRGRAVGGGAMGRPCGHRFPTRAAAMCSLLAVEGGRRKEGKKKQKEKKRKNIKNF
jgi:hypothetical protein